MVNLLRPTEINQAHWFGIFRNNKNKYILEQKCINNESILLET